MKNKILKISLRVLIILVALVIGVLSLFAFVERMIFFDFYKNAVRFERVPGLWEGYIAQGYTQAEGEDYRLACGYMKDGEASRIYVLRDDGDVEYSEMKKQDGKDHTGHTGGVAIYGKYVYISAAEGCDLFLLSDVLDGDGVATQVGTVSTINDPAYVVIHDGMMYTGSFYREENYKTPTEHHITTPAGDNNTAIISVYRLDPDTHKTVSDTPDYVYSTTGLVQGIALTGDGRIILSTSYGLAKSHLYVYDLDEAQVNKDGFDVNGVKVPLIYLDSSCLTDDIIAPPMAEEIIYDDSIVYIMNESASMKYIFGKFTSGNHVYGYKLDK